MADEVTRIMIIPLRGARLAPRSRRTERAVKEVRNAIMRHLKVDAEHVWIDKSVNEKLWENGIRNPPSKIAVKAVKFDDGLVEVTYVEPEPPKRDSKKKKEPAAKKTEAAPVAATKKE